MLTWLQNEKWTGKNKYGMIYWYTLTLTWTMTVSRIIMVGYEIMWGCSSKFRIVEEGDPGRTKSRFSTGKKGTEGGSDPNWSDRLGGRDDAKHIILLLWFFFFLQALRSKFHSVCVWVCWAHAQCHPIFVLNVFINSYCSTPVLLSIPLTLLTYWSNHSQSFLLLVLITL